MIGYNTVFEKTIKLSEGPKVMKNVTVMSQTLIQQKGRRLASTIGRNEKISVKRPSQLAEQEQWDRDPHIIGEM